MRAKWQCACGNFHFADLHCCPYCGAVNPPPVVEDTHENYPISVTEEEMDFHMKVCSYFKTDVCPNCYSEFYNRDFGCPMCGEPKQGR